MTSLPPLYDSVTLCLYSPNCGAVGWSAVCDNGIYQLPLILTALLPIA